MKKLDPALKCLMAVDRACRVPCEPRMVKAALEWAWDKYVTHADTNLPKKQEARCPIDRMD